MTDEHWTITGPKGEPFCKMQKHTVTLTRADVTDCDAPPVPAERVSTPQRIFSVIEGGK